MLYKISQIPRVWCHIKIWNGEGDVMREIRKNKKGR